MFFEPCEQTVFEFFGGGAEGAAVVGGGDWPEFCVGGVGVDDLRMAKGDVAIHFAMD